MNCYNSDSYLREALESVLGQSFIDWEIVFWDNQSTDQSAEIFKSYEDSRFCYFKAEEHTTLGQARNLAVERATGPWLAFLDCDDLWSTDKLEKQFCQIEGNDSEIGLVYCPVEYKFDTVESSTSQLADYYHRLKTIPHPKKTIYHDLLEGNFIFFSSLLIRHSLYLEVGGVDDSLSQNEDYDLVLKASRLVDAVCIEDICVKYRIHESNNSHTQAELSYQENQNIYKMLPHDKYVDRALKMNASRYAVFMMRNGRLIAGVTMLAIHGSFFWVLKRCFARVFYRIRQVCVL